MKSSLSKMVSFTMLIVILFGIYRSMPLFHINEFESFLLVYPISIFLIGIFSFILFKNIWAGPFVTFLGSIFSMFTIFNTTFWIYILVYVFICFLGSLIGKGVLFFLRQINKHS